MKYCEEYAALLDPFVDGELSLEEAARVRAHLKVCGGCRSYVDAALSMRDAFPDVEGTDVPEGFADRVMAVVRAEPVSQTKTAPQKRVILWKKILLPMAACLAIIVAAGQLPRMGGGSASDTAVMTAQAPAMAEESAVEAETPGLSIQTTEDAGEAEHETMEDSVQAVEEKRSLTVFTTQGDVSGNIQESASAPKQQDGSPAAKDVPQGAPAAFSASVRTYARQAAVSLSEEQREQLLSDHEAEPQPDGTIRYTMTAEAFDAVSAALEEAGVQLDIQLDEGADPDLCCLIVTIA